MKIKIALICISCLFVYTLLLSCIGIFGVDVQNILFKYGLIFIKWFSIIFGFFMCIFLPIRIIVALEKNKQNKYYTESDEKIRQAGAEKKALEEKILKEYIKSEDMI